MLGQDVGSATDEIVDSPRLLNDDCRALMSFAQSGTDGLVGISRSLIRQTSQLIDRLFCCHTFVFCCRAFACVSEKKFIAMRMSDDFLVPTKINFFVGDVFFLGFAFFSRI